MLPWNNTTAAPTYCNADVGCEFDYNWVVIKLDDTISKILIRASGYSYNIGVTYERKFVLTAVIMILS